MTDFLFPSDNAAGVCPEVMDAMIRCDAGTAIAYGDDPWTARVNDAFSQVFEHEVSVFSVTSGTAANALALAAVTPSYGLTLCHARAHILTTEGGAPEFYAGGSRLAPIPGADGKMDVAALTLAMTAMTRPSKHHLACSSLSITQATEAGTIHTIEELAALCDLAHGHGLKVQMDGARFSNALAALGATPAAMSWKCGIDVLSLGTTKNGTMNAEAVIVFDPAMARDIAYRQKRGGLLTSRMRYLSAQLLAFVHDDLWLTNARRANRTAAELARMLSVVPGIRLLHPVDTNQIFVEIQPPVAEALARAGIWFRVWDPKDPLVYRLVATFRDEASEVARLKRAVADIAVTVSGSPSLGPQ